MTSNQDMTYRRGGSKGTLKLGGDVDINVATTLCELARRALSDAKAQSVYVEMSHVERLDIAALQILSALKRDVVAAGRDFHISGNSADITENMSRIGISL